MIHPPRSRLQAAEQLLDALNTLQRAWEARWREICDAEDTHPSQAQALLFLLRRGPVPMNELSGGLCIAPSTATRLVEQMEKQGWMTRSPDREDRRRVLIHLLAEGEERAWQVLARARDTVRSRAAGPPERTLRDLESLRSLADGLVPED